MHARPTIARAWATTGTLVALVVGLLGLGLVSVGAMEPAPAMAAIIDLGDDQPRPVTWVDAEGRQLVAVGDHRTTVTEPAALLILRDQPDGRPDATWGSWQGRPGARLVALEAPAPGVVREGLVAASDAGVLTTTWTTPGCTEPCARWFARHRADGSAVGTPRLVDAVQRPQNALPDGSLLVARDGSDEFEWRGPDGTDRGTLDRALYDVIRGSIDLDGEGRLLYPTREAFVRRAADGTTTALVPTASVSPACGGSGFGAAIGSAPDGGFAVACGLYERADFQVVRFDADGTEQWRSIADGAERMDVATRLVVADDGTVWVGGAWFDNDKQGHVIAQPFTAAGAGVAAYVRGAEPGWRGSGASITRELTDLRRVSGGVALAEGKTCCGTPAGRVVAAVLPAAPRCDLADPITIARTTTVRTIRFPTCRAGFVDRPLLGTTSYRIDVEGPDGTTSQAVHPDRTDLEATATVPAPVAGELVDVTVTAVNEVGDGIGRPGRLTDVAPFSSPAAFVAAVHLDLDRTPASTAALAADTARILDRTTTPAALVAELLASGRGGVLVEPTTRLYRASFLRDPDRAGLDHWTTSYARGTKLGTIADKFARSSEFRSRYGPLTDRAFVAKVYENAFGRRADPAGLAYWTTRLDQRRITRGGLILQFSESSEFRRTSAGAVQPLAAALLLIDRLPDPSERATWSGAPDPRAAAVAAILASDEYADRAT